MVVGSSKKREEAGEGSRTHPQAQTQLQLGAPGWGGAGLGEGEGESLGRSSSGLLRRPRQCRGRGSRRREGEEGAGPRRSHPHARTRTARAHSQITARPGESSAQAQVGRPRGVWGKAVLGLGGPRRDIPGRRERYEVGVGAGASDSLFFPAVGEAHSLGWVRRGRSEQIVEPWVHKGSGKGPYGEGRLLTRTSSRSLPKSDGGYWGLCAPAPARGQRSRTFPGMWSRPGEWRAAVRLSLGGLGRSLWRGSSSLPASLGLPLLPRSGDDFVTCLSGASVVRRVSPLPMSGFPSSRGFPGFSFHQRLHLLGIKAGKMETG